jgi:magnesium-protoporphyrin IX monomethyl ester (oxidative) cyclase
VFDITTKICQQVFPVTLSWDDPRFAAGLDALCRLQDELDAAKAGKGPFSLVRRGWVAVKATAVFARLYLLPVRENRLPENARLSPTW